MKNTASITGRKILVSDLKRGYGSWGGSISKAVERVLESGWYILGRECEAFEEEFADYCGSRYAIGVASGTEAIQLSLMSLSIGRGDDVITAPNTAIPTAMAIAAAGARPRFVDVCADTFNMDISRLEAAITKNTRAIVPVHLYGNPCRMKELMDIARRHNLYIIEDACQAHGAARGSRRTGTFGDLGAFSFYPTKNLGACGDGGAIVTDNKKLAGKLRLMRNYGQKTRYLCEEAGINSRLDEIQAAILRVKLRYLDRFNMRRREIARLYARYLEGVDQIGLPVADKDAEHVFHLFVVKCSRRNSLMEYLAANNVETQVHYPIPLHLQKAFKGLGYRKGDFPCAEKLSAGILSLPVFPEMKDGEVRRICRLIRNFYFKS